MKITSLSFLLAEYAFALGKTNGDLTLPKLCDRPHQDCQLVDFAQKR